LSQEGWQVIRFWECEIKKDIAQKLLAAGFCSGKESGTTKNA
jgi:G:T-mismatch repair DNA endonuclease (very short patch repair protein)